MIVQSIKTGLEQELTTEQWEQLKAMGLQRKFRVLESGQSVKKQKMEFPDTLEVKEIKKTTKKK